MYRYIDTYISEKRAVEKKIWPSCSRVLKVLIESIGGSLLSHRVEIQSSRPDSDCRVPLDIVRNLDESGNCAQKIHDFTFREKHIVCSSDVDPSLVSYLARRTRHGRYRIELLSISDRTTPSGREIRLVYHQAPDTVCDIWSTVPRFTFTLQFPGSIL